MKMFVLKGLFKQFASTPKSIIGLIDFNKIIKPVLKGLGITYNDSCCPSTEFTTVRYNLDLDQLEYLSDPEAGTWTAVV